MDIFILQSLFPFQNGCILLDKNRLKEYGVTAKALPFGLSTQDVAQAPKYVCSLSLCPPRLAAPHSAAFTLLWVTTAHTTRPKGAGFSQQQKPPSRDYTLYWCRNTPTIQLSPALKEHCCKITIASSWSLHPHLPWERVKLQSVEAHPAAPLAAVGNANPPKAALGTASPEHQLQSLAPLPHIRSYCHSCKRRGFTQPSLLSMRLLLGVPSKARKMKHLVLEFSLDSCMITNDRSPQCLPLCPFCSSI